MKRIIETFRIGILLGVVMTGSNGFAQTTTNPQQEPVSSGEVLTRTPKAGQPEKTGCTELTPVKREGQSEKTIISGCTELTRITPVNGQNSGSTKTNEVPVIVDPIKKD